MTSGEKQPIRPISSAIRWLVDCPGSDRTCSKCGGEMVIELLRPDPHDTPVLFLVCSCGYWEAPPPDIEAALEERPRMPGF